MKQFNAIILFALLSFSGLQGQLSIDTIDLSSTVIPLKIKETGRNITVITAADIAKMPATSLDEVLQTVTGLEVQSRGAFGVQGDILMRGSTFTQVLVLIDGMKMNDPLTGHFNNYIPVTTEEIARIEVLRGAASAMYGADAVGGVINIVTKVFDNSEQKNTIGGSLGYGQNKLINTQVGFVKGNSKTKIGGGVTYLKSDGEAIDPVVIDTATMLAGYRNFFDIKTVGLSVSHKLTKKLTLSARSSFDHRDFSARYFYTTSPFDKSNEIVSNFFNRIQLARIGDKSSSDFNVAYKRNKDEFVFSPDFPSTNNHTSELLNLTANHLYTLSDKITLKGGIQLDQRAIESNDRGDHADAHLGAYVMGVYQKAGFNGAYSIRADYDDNYDFELSPSLNVSYVMPRLVLRGSAGRSIRAADYTERYVSNNLVDLTPGRSLGNPDLKAEKGWSQELGVDVYVGNMIELSGTFFARQSENLIDYVSTTSDEIGVVSEIGSLRDSSSYFFAKNISEVSTLGLELQARFVGKIYTHPLRMSIGYTYANTSNEADVVSVYISSHAKHLVSAQGYIDMGPASLSLSCLYKNRELAIAEGIATQLDPSYFLWNAKIQVPIIPQLQAYVDVRNVSNTAYQNVLGARMPGRWIMGGINFRL